MLMSCEFTRRFRIPHLLSPSECIFISRIITLIYADMVMFYFNFVTTKSETERETERHTNRNYHNRRQVYSSASWGARQSVNYRFIRRDPSSNVQPASKSTYDLICDRNSFHHNWHFRPINARSFRFPLSHRPSVPASNTSTKWRFSASFRQPRVAEPDRHFSVDIFSSFSQTFFPPCACFIISLIGRRQKICLHSLQSFNRFRFHFINILYLHLEWTTHRERREAREKRRKTMRRRWRRRRSSNLNASDSVAARSQYYPMKFKYFPSASC